MFLFNDTATTEIYTLSLHDALPILLGAAHVRNHHRAILASIAGERTQRLLERPAQDLHAEPLVVVGELDVVERGKDRKSTRLNSSHANISYAVFCLKKKKTLHVSTY